MGRPFSLFLVVTCVSCLDPTQITVKIGTTYDCATNKTDTAMWIGDESGSTGPLDKFTATKSCTSGTVVGDIVVVPRKSADDAVWVRVLAGLNGTDPQACSLPQAADAGPMPNIQCIEAKRILRFVRHSKLEVSITLDSACINVRCPGKNDTCKAGMCVDAHEDPMDAGPIPDAGREAEAAPIFKPASDLFAGFDNVCATAANGVYCWGANKTSQLGAPGMDSGPMPISLPISITSMSIGGGHICATNGTDVYCWGLGTSGELGRQVFTMNGIDPKPTLVMNVPKPVTSLHSGAKFNCVFDKQPACWGTVISQIVYQGVTPLQYNFTAFAVGAHHLCGIAISKVECWGDNSKAQLDQGVSTPYSIAPMAGVTGAKWVLAGFNHSVADEDLGLLAPMCNFACDVGWGSNAGMELGGNVNPVQPAKRINTAATKIALGENHLCTLDVNGVRCRGSNTDAQLGGGSIDMTGFSAVPVMGATKVVAGRTFSCALASGHVFCWGSIPGVMTKQQTPVEVFLPP